MKSIGVIVPLIMAAVLATGSIAGSALAGGGENREAAAMGAKVSLTEAIATAEQQTGGRAYDAGVDTKNGRPRIVVETNGPNGVQTVLVDGSSGQAVSSHPGGEED